jgi:hypothetical protein
MPNMNIWVDGGVHGKLKAMASTSGLGLGDYVRTVLGRHVGSPVKDLGEDNITINNNNIDIEELRAMAAGDDIRFEPQVKRQYTPEQLEAQRLAREANERVISSRRAGSNET